jgi:hypothetical protein
VVTATKVLDVAWLCPCGQRVGAGERVHPWGEAWRCAACLPTPAPTPWRRKPVQANNQEEPMPRGKPGSWTHGTESGYRQGGCRQECCRAAHREYNAERNAVRNARDPKRRPPYNLTELPGPVRQPKPRPDRYAKGTTLEELLRE